MKNYPFQLFHKKKMIDIDKFLNTYKDKLNNHLILGYYSHLLTDQFYNEKIYTTKWIKDKNVPAHKIGKQWKFKRSELDAWVKSGKSAIE